MNWIVFTTGFRQSPGELTALEVLQNDIHREFTDPNTRILLRSWKDDVRELAERIEAYKPTDYIFLIGYSYGGYSTKLLCKELRKMGLNVTYCFMIDAVWRPTSFLPSSLSLLPHWKIKLPDNVKRCKSWRQQITRPYGHEVVPSELTEFQEQTLIRGHVYMDDAFEIHDEIKSELRDYLK